MKKEERHGADQIPPPCLRLVKQYLWVGDRSAAGVLLSELCVHSRLMCYEAHHLAIHLEREVEKEKRCVRNIVTFAMS